MNKETVGNHKVIHSEPGSVSGGAVIPPENLTPLQAGATPHYAGDGHGATTESGVVESRLGKLDRLTREELIRAGASAMSAMVAANTDAPHRPAVMNSQEVPPDDFLG